jgi:hypothetical protein
MGYVDINVAKQLEKLFEDQIREFDSRSYRLSDRELKKLMRELGDFELGCQTGKRRNRELKAG